MYTPSNTILQKYAEVMIDFALHSGKGIKKNDVVLIAGTTVVLPMLRALYTRVLKSGGHPILNIQDDECKKQFFLTADEKQLTFFPEQYYKGIAGQIQHWIRVLGEEDPFFLKNVNPARLMQANKAVKPFRTWLDEKEDTGKFTWTLCLYGTEATAAEAGISIQTYWNEIINACFLKDKNPAASWKKVYTELYRTLTKLNNLDIQKLHITADGTDLSVTVGQKRRWLGGRGRNIPSFEIFTSPDWRHTEGKVRFDLPLYRYGSIIRDIDLVFTKGRITNASAKKNNKLLTEMIQQKNADRIGEFSLTDRRFSRISRFMANTLYDENFGGKYGNMHLAVGKAYNDTFSGNIRRLTPALKTKLGFNDSPEHTDIIATTPRTVEAVDARGRTKVIYRDGMFRI